MMKGLCEEQLPLVWSKGGRLGLSWASDSLSKTSRTPSLKPAVLLLDHSAHLDCSENVRRDITHVHRGSHSDQTSARFSSRSAQLLLALGASPTWSPPGLRHGPDSLFISMLKGSEVL